MEYTIRTCDIPCRLVNSPRYIRLSRFLISNVVAWTLCAIAAAPSSAQLVKRFEVANLVFSPDQDGIEENTNVNFLLETGGAPVVSLVVFETDSVTPVDTLLAPQPRPAGRTDAFWDGLAWDGTPAPDGGYVVTLSAAGATLPDTTTHRLVYIDRGTATVVVDAVSPGIYAPGVDGQPPAIGIAFTVTGATPPLPGVLRDEVQRAFFQPPNTVRFTPDSLSYVPDFEGADGSYILKWRAQTATGLPNGEYLVTLTIVDQAGHSSSSSHTFRIDSKIPDVRITSPATGSSFRQSPALLRGWAFDASGVRSVDIKYADQAPYITVIDTSTVNDTLYFEAPLADSLAGEGNYKITVRATDAFARTAMAAADVVIDVSAPEAPVLDPFVGVWHTDTFRVSGTFQKESDVLARIRITRNGAAVDSIFTLPIGDPFAFERVIGLVPGRNAIAALYVDGAGNVSAPSNTVEVTFDLAVGLFIAAPFTPGDDFQVTLAKAAHSLALRVYDMTGDLVVALSDEGGGTTYSIPWDGHNGNGDRVDRGPLVAVAEVSFSDGDRSIYRELFLFDPYPK